MNYIYLPSGRDVWLDVSNKLLVKGLTPKIWLGDVGLTNKAIKVNDYKSCYFYNYHDINLGVFPEGLDLENKSVIPVDIISSREFLKLKDQVYKTMDRQDNIRVFARLEREALFYLLFCHFFSKIKECDIKFLFASEAPHTAASLILYGICKILNIPTFHCNASGIAPMFVIANDLYGSFVELAKNDEANTKILKKKLSSYIKQTNSAPVEPSYMKNQKDFDRSNKSDFSSIALDILKKIKSRYSKESNRYMVNKPLYLDDNRVSLIESVYVKRLRRKLLNSYLDIVSDVKFDTDYVFFPLHYEPERTSNPDGGDYYLVYDAIAALRSFVPQNIPIYVKEHYSQFTNMLYGYRGKSPYLYRAIRELPNVYFLDYKLNTENLIRNSIFTASQTGTACLEAACMGTKAVLMGDVWFSHFPNIFRFSDIDDFEKLSEEKVECIDEIFEFSNYWVDKFMISGCINPSNERYFQAQYDADEYNALLSDDVTSTLIVDTISSELARLSN